MNLLGKWIWKFKLESVGLRYKALACRYGAGEGVDLGKVVEIILCGGVKLVI